MKVWHFSAFLFFCCALLSADAASAQATPPRLESLKGTLHIITETSGNLGNKTVATQVWAKGNNTRIEMLLDTGKAISVQRGNSIYVYREGEKTGTRQEVSGLAAMGLVRQIEYIKSKAKVTRSEVIQGDVYDHYELRDTFPDTTAEVLLSAKTSLPRTWYSIVRTDDGMSYLEEYLYSDMESNVDLPDSLFELPPNVKFNLMRNR
jgi:outer membrane lipoprotein-sorting protein